MSKTEIQTVKFAGTDLDCMQEDQGVVWVSLRRACEGMGIDYSGQLSRIKTQHWAVMEMISTTGSDGKTYEMTMIDLDTLGMWLATIQSSRVSTKARPQVERYQREVVKVIREAFFPSALVAPKQPMQPMSELEMISILSKTMLEERRQTEAKFKAIESKVEDSLETAQAFGQDLEHLKQEIEDLSTTLQNPREITLALDSAIREYADFKCIQDPLKTPREVIIALNSNLKRYMRGKLRKNYTLADCRLAVEWLSNNLDHDFSHVLRSSVKILPFPISKTP